MIKNKILLAILLASTSTYSVAQNSDSASMEVIVKIQNNIAPVGNALAMVSACPGLTQYEPEAEKELESRLSDLIESRKLLKVILGDIYAARNAAGLKFNSAEEPHKQKICALTTQAVEVWQAYKKEGYVDNKKGYTLVDLVVAAYAGNLSLPQPVANTESAQPSNAPLQAIPGVTPEYF